MRDNSEESFLQCAAECRKLHHRAGNFKAAWDSTTPDDLLRLVERLGESARVAIDRPRDDEPNGAADRARAAARGAMAWLDGDLPGLVISGGPDRDHERGDFQNQFCRLATRVALKAGLVDAAATTPQVLRVWWRYFKATRSPFCGHLDELIDPCLALASACEDFALGAHRVAVAAVPPPAASISAPFGTPSEVPDSPATVASARPFRSKSELVTAYVAEVRTLTPQKRFSKREIWIGQGYTSPTEFQRWQRDDPRTTRTARQKFDRVLKEKPHLKK